MICSLSTLNSYEHLNTRDSFVCDCVQTAVHTWQRTWNKFLMSRLVWATQIMAFITMAFITAQNTLSTFLTFWHLFDVQGVKFPSHVSRRKIYDVNLVLASLRRKIYQRLFYGEKSIILQCTLKVVPSLLKVFKYITTWLYLAWHVTT